MSVNGGAEYARLFVDKKRRADVISYGRCTSGSKAKYAFYVHFFSEARNLEIFGTETRSPLAPSIW